MKRIIVSLSLIIGLVLMFQTALFAESDWKIIRQADWETSFNDVYFVDGYNGWAVGSGGVIAHTKDRGETWCPQNSGGNWRLNSVDFVNADEGWIAGEVILHTNDAGENWVVQDAHGASLSDVDFVNANEGWVVGGYGIILHTNDGGTTWTPQDSGVETWLSAVCFASPQDGWVVGENGTILHTNNGGNDWEKQISNTTEYLYDVHFVSTNEGWAVGDNGVILHTSNGGTDWIFQDSGTTRRLCDVHFVSAAEGWAMSLFFNILYTSDGGATWYQLNGQTFMGCSPFWIETHYPKTHFIDSSEGWVVTSFGHIFHTVDGGNTWTYQIDTPGSTLYSVDFVNPVKGWAVDVVLHTGNSGVNWTIQWPWLGHVGLDFVSPDEGWIVGEDIWYTSNGGVSWEEQYDTQFNEKYPLYDVHFVNLTSGWVVGNNGTILHTDDGGENWIEQNSGVSSQLRGVAFVNDSEGWAVGDDGVILHTSDGGENWEQQPSGTSNLLSGLSFVSDTEGWVVGENIILHTDDGGTTWTPQAEGYWLRDVVFVNKNEGWAVGDSGVILHTDDGGAIWTQQDSGMDNNLQGICYDGYSSLYAVGEWGIVLRYIDPTLALDGTPIAGALSGTLTLENSPYIVMGDISVPETETLVIEPGVQVRFNGKYQFDVYGTLQAVGTEADPILFTSNQANPQPGDWRSINFVNSEGSIVQYCRLEYGSWSETGYIYYCVINCENSSPTISDNVIANNARGGIICHEHSNPTISKNRITDNGWVGVYIHNNSSPMVIGNVISNNDNDGIHFNSGGNPSIINNVVFNNAGWGIGAQVGISSDSVNCNTVYGNSVGICAGPDTEITVRNCIVWGNGTEISIDPSAIFSITYSDVQGGWEGEGNIDKNPLFAHAEKGDFYLNDFSPCIGTGTSEGAPTTDIEGNPRGTPPDMGAYENPRNAPRLIGDVSGNDTISAYDAALILQYTVGLIDRFPAEIITSPSEVMPRDYAVSLPSLTAKAGDRIQIPIRISDATGLVAGGISVKYDSTVLRAIDVAISPWASGVYWRANTELKGEVRVAFAGAQPLEGKGNLFHVTYEVLPNAEGVTTPLILDVQFSNSLDIATVNGWITVLPSRSMLFQNYPNPFNPETWIPFQLAQDATVQVNIYNSKGQLIRRLNLGQKHAGSYITKARAAYWNGQDEHGNRVASGLYFYSLQAGDFTATRKMVILK